MLRFTRALIFISLVLLFVMGCSSSSDNPLIPHENESAGAIDSLPIIGASIYENGSFNAIGVFGTFEISIDAKNGSAELVAKRNPAIGESYIVNGISYFTITPCPDCLKLKSLGLDLPYVKAVFSISHPFEKGDPFKPPSAVNRLDLDVFDLALVIVPTDSTPAQYALTSADIYTEICGNVDGYTTELTEVTSDSAACPYFLVLDDSETGISKFNRFEMGSKDVEFDAWFKGGHFDLYLTMGYGASAKKAQRLEPTYYNPEFNRKNAWKVNVIPPEGANPPEMGNTWNDTDDSTPYNVTVKVYDWQIDATVDPNLDDPTDIYAASNVASVSVEIPGMNNTLQVVTTPTGTHTGLPDDPLIYTVPVANENLLTEGEYIGLVKVTDERVPPSTPAPGETDALVDVPDGINISYVGIPEFATYQIFAATVILGCLPPVPTSIDPNQMMTYPGIPGIYDDVTITGNYFELAGGVTEVYLDDGTTQVYADDINVLSDTELTCDFDLFPGFDGDDGMYDVVVITTCEGRGENLVEIIDNLLFYANFADGDGDCEGIGDGYVYCESDGWWEEYTCGSDYTTYGCYKFMTPLFDVPVTAQDVHYRMRHSMDTYAPRNGCVDGWTPDDGNTFYGDINDGNNYWKYESDWDRVNGLTDFWGPHDNPSCIGDLSNYNWNYRFYCHNFGSLGTGIWSQFHLDGTENLIGMENARFMLAFVSGLHFSKRGHEVYELIIWYDP